VRLDPDLKMVAQDLKMMRLVQVGLFCVFSRSPLRVSRSLLISKRCALYRTGSSKPQTRSSNAVSRNRFLPFFLLFFFRGKPQTRSSNAVSRNRFLSFFLLFFFEASRRLAAPTPFRGTGFSLFSPIFFSRQAADSQLQRRFEEQVSLFFLLFFFRGKPQTRSSNAVSRNRWRQ
jgi:hypothetical protein